MVVIGCPAVNGCKLMESSTMAGYALTPWQATQETAAEVAPPVQEGPCRQDHHSVCRALRGQQDAIGQRLARRGGHLKGVLSREVPLNQCCDVRVLQEPRQCFLHPIGRTVK